MSSKERKRKKSELRPPRPVKHKHFDIQIIIAHNILMLREKGFAALEIPVAIVLLILCAGVGYYVWRAHHVAFAPTATPSLATGKIEKSLRFNGVVTHDGCTDRTTSVPIGDIGCSITVDGKTVGIVHGNMRYPHGWGTLKGFSQDKDITGSRVSVYARQNGANSQFYDLGGSRYFVELAK